MRRFFLRYATIGVINTAIHWLSFYFLVLVLGIQQSLANLLGFCIAVTFSFFCNAKWTFNASISLLRYCLFTAFMGFIAFSMGWLADHTPLPSILMLIAFSAISMVCGFFYSRFVVFTDAGR